MKKLLIKSASLLLLLAFYANTTCYGLATLPASQNPVAKIEISAALQRTQIRYAESEDAIRLLSANNAECLLLSSGKYLVKKEVAENDLRLLRAIIHEDIEAIMQIINKEDRHKYLGIKELIIKHFPPSENNNLPIELYINHLIAKAFEWLIPLHEKILTEDTMPYQDMDFLREIIPLIMANKHNYFTAEFWDSNERGRLIKEARNKGMIFYQVSSGNEKKADDIKAAAEIINQKVSALTLAIKTLVVPGDKYGIDSGSDIEGYSYEELATAIINKAKDPSEVKEYIETISNYFDNMQSLFIGKIYKHNSEPRTDYSIKPIRRLYLYSWITTFLSEAVKGTEDLRMFKSIIRHAISEFSGAYSRVKVFGNNMQVMVPNDYAELLVKLYRESGDPIALEKVNKMFDEIYDADRIHISYPARAAIVRAVSKVSHTGQDLEYAIRAVRNAIVFFNCNNHKYCTFESSSSGKNRYDSSGNDQIYYVTQIDLDKFVEHLESVAEIAETPERFKRALQLDAVLGGVLSTSHIVNSENSVGACPDTDNDTTYNYVRIDFNSVIYYLKNILGEDIVRRFIDSKPVESYILGGAYTIRKYLGKEKLNDLVNQIQGLNDRSSTAPIPEKKCLVIRANGILWGGTVEDGPTGVDLSERYITFQRKLLELKKKDIALVLIYDKPYGSRTPWKLESIFDAHPELPIRLSDFKKIISWWEDETSWCSSAKELNTDPKNIALFDQIYDIGVLEDFIDMLLKQNNGPALPISTAKVDPVIIKCVALDCDGVLWDGVIGEDGLQGIQVTDAHKAFQLKLKELKAKGVLLVISSKNNLHDVEKVLAEHPDMILRREDFAAVRANWQDKATNLQEIAKELNLGLDSFVFIDDTPEERALVSMKCPQVLTPELTEDIAGRIKYIDGLNIMPRNTKEDRRRTELYVAHKQRTELKNQSVSLEDFYRSLDMRVIIRQGKANLPYVSRIAQLTQRTNQFNLTTRRYTEDEIRDLITGRTDRESGYDIFTMEFIDRFGNAGIVGVMVVKKYNRNRPNQENKAVYDVEEFCLSCRAVGLTIEQSFMSYVIRSLQAYNEKARLTASYVPTDRNGLVRDLYGSFGLKKVEPSRHNSDLWEAELDNINVAAPEWVSTENFPKERQEASVPDIRNTDQFALEALRANLIDLQEEGYKSFDEAVLSKVMPASDIKRLSSLVQKISDINRNILGQGYSDFGFRKDMGRIFGANEKYGSRIWPQCMDDAEEVVELERRLMGYLVESRRTQQKGESCVVMKSTCAGLHKDMELAKEEYLPKKEDPEYDYEIGYFQTSAEQEEYDSSVIHYGTAYYDIILTKYKKEKMPSSVTIKILELAKYDFQETMAIIRKLNKLDDRSLLRECRDLSMIGRQAMDTEFDAQSATVLLTDLIYGHLHEDKIYEIKYDTSRLTTSQIEIIEEYARLLQLRSSNTNSVKLKPFSSAQGSKESLIAVYCTGKDFKGEGHVDIAIPEGELKDYLLRIAGMVNIALASSNIPDNLSREDIDKYRPIMSYIKNQYKAILGEELAIPDSPEDILKVIRRIVLGLPKSMRMDTGQIEEFNRLAKAALTAA